MSFVYQIFVDRFSTGSDKKDLELSNKSYTQCQLEKSCLECESKGCKAFLGGNLKGIIKKLNYIKYLGADSIWISPIFKSAAYHGYHVTDYFSIDKRFGVERDLRRLVKNAHRNGLKIILDFVPNHCSYYHPLFQDALKNRNKDWFVFFKHPEKYMCFMGCKEIPKLNTRNEKVQKYLLKVAKFWIEKFDIDGYRIDHSAGPAFDFLKKLYTMCKNEKPNFELFHEIAIGKVDDKFFRKGRVSLEELKTLWALNRIQKIKWIFGLLHGRRLRGFEKIGGILNFWACDLIRDYFAGGLLSTKKFVSEASKMNRFNFQNNYAFLDNHDMDRFFSICKGCDWEKMQRMRLALVFLFFQPFRPIIYQGTEIPMAQVVNRDEKLDFKDSEFRRFFDWKKLKEAMFIMLIKELSGLRKNFNGSPFEVGGKKGCLVIKRGGYRVLLNLSPKDVEFLFKERIIRIDGKTKGNKIRLNPFGFCIMK